MRSQQHQDQTNSSGGVSKRHRQRRTAGADVDGVSLAAYPVIMLLTVRTELLLLLLAALGRELPRLGHTHLVAASVPVLRSKGRSLRAFLAEERPDLVLYDISSLYQTNWTVLNQVRASGALPAERLITLTANAQALEAAAGPNAAIEVPPGAATLDDVVAGVQHQLAQLPPRQACLADTVCRPGTSAGLRVPARPTRAEPDVHAVLRGTP